MLNVKLINEDNQVNDYIQQLLINRGIESEDDFFNHDWSAVLSPYDLDNISEAANMILKHMNNPETVIAVLVDSDMDGYSSAALLYNYFSRQRQCGTFSDLPRMEFLFHEMKDHGLGNTKIMRQIRDEVKPSLLIVPDASGTDEQYAALNNLGIDIVVLDHHHMDNKGDGVKTIVVNNQQSERYSNKNLSGVGVTWQLCRVLDEKLSLAISDEFLDLVALGLAADVMDFRSPETKFLIREGLLDYNINRPFLKMFAQENVYALTGGKDLSRVHFNYTKVSWNIAPLFNAINRVGTLDERRLLFNALLDDKALEDYPSGKRGEKGVMVPLAKEALRVASNAKARQKRRQDKLTEIIDKIIAEDNLLKDAVIVVPIDDFDADQRSLSGLIAGKLSEWYCRPCVLVFQSGDTFNGSLRCPEGIDAYANFKQQCQDSGLVLYAEGHPYAAGIGIHKDNIQKVRDYFNEKYSGIDTTITAWVDYIVDAKDDLTDLAEALSTMEDFWGQGFKEPLIAITNVPLKRSNLVLFKADTNPTLKIELPSGASCIKFKSSKEEFNSLILPFDGVEQQFKATIVGKLSINEFNGNRTPQLKVEEYAVNKAEYVF